jgi:stress response protein SCP2
MKMRSLCQGNFTGEGGKNVEYKQLQLETVDQETGRIKIEHVSIPQSYYNKIPEYTKLENQLVHIPVTSNTRNGKVTYRLSGDVSLAK